MTNRVSASETELKESTLETIAPSESNSLDRITPVAQLEKIGTGDWQWQALKFLSQQYKVKINFNGDRSLTRYEFAVQFNAILERIPQLVTINKIGREDLAVLQRLQTEFATELSSLHRRRVEVLEQQVSQLEAQQTSTTTTLSGQALFAFSGAAGDEKADGSGEGIDDNLILSDRLRLNFDSSFTGQDRYMSAQFGLFLSSEFSARGLVCIAAISIAKFKM